MREEGRGKRENKFSEITKQFKSKNKIEF